MPLVYESPPANGALRQGEILKNVFDHRSVSPAVRLPENKVEYHQYSHEYVIVLTNDCDLDLEYRERNNIPGPGENGRIPQYRLLAYLLLCDVYAEETLKAERRGQQGSAAGMNSQEWRRVTQNQDERYHCFEEAEIVIIRAQSYPDSPLIFLKLVRSLLQVFTRE